MYDSIKITDWLMVIITLVYVIATVFICLYNRKAVQASQKQLIEMKSQYDEFTRPKIVVYFEIIRKALLCFVIENIGQNAACNVEVRVNQEFIDNLEEDEKKILIGLNESKMFLCSKQHI